jgi:mitochondrial fission protein ELM1
LRLGLAGILAFPRLIPQLAREVERTLTIWRISDGKPGHDNQSRGLAEAILRSMQGGEHIIKLGETRGFFARLRAAVKAAAFLPAPDLILAAGHATHPALLWLARKFRAKSVVLMKPSLPLSWFDLCIAPEHDFPDGCAAPNLILTRGALNRVRPGSGEKSGKLILLGGPSKTHGWDAAAVLSMLAKTTDRGGWELTDSRRTPEGFLDQIRERFPGIAVYSHSETPPGWVPDKLREAKEAWVTEDSVSMIYEALTSGARVGLLPVPRLVQNSRVLCGIDRLVADGFLTTYARWSENQRLADPPETLRETERCAEIILAMLCPNRTAKA